MFVLEATRETQGSRDDDYAWAVDGELVFIPLTDCDNERCGCARGFAGITSHRATTTARIVDRPDLDADGYRDVLTEGMKSQGYDICGIDVLVDHVDEVLSAVSVLGKTFGAGTVVGRTGPALLIRSPGAPVGGR